MAKPNNLILNALLGRMTLDNNDVIELQTKYDPTSNTIELTAQYLEQLNKVQRGPNFQGFISWLIGSSSGPTIDGGTFDSGSF